MPTHKIKTAVSEDRTVTLENLPFAAGQSIEITVVASGPRETTREPYPLRGTPVSFHSPTAPVAESDWETTK